MERVSSEPLWKKHFLQDCFFPSVVFLLAALYGIYAIVVDEQAILFFGGEKTRYNNCNCEMLRPRIKKVDAICLRPRKALILVAVSCVIILSLFLWKFYDPDNVNDGIYPFWRQFVVRCL